MLLINEDTNEKNIVVFSDMSFIDDDSFGMHNMICAFKEYGHKMKNCMIFWFNLERNQYIYIGNDPIPNDLYICLSPLAMNKVGSC